MTCTLKALIWRTAPLGHPIAPLRTAVKNVGVGGQTPIIIEKDTNLKSTVRGDGQVVAITAFDLTHHQSIMAWLMSSSSCNSCLIVHYT